MNRDTDLGEERESVVARLDEGVRPEHHADVESNHAHAQATGVSREHTTSNKTLGKQVVGLFDWIGGLTRVGRREWEGTRSPK